MQRVAAVAAAVSCLCLWGCLPPWKSLARCSREMVGLPFVCALLLKWRCDGWTGKWVCGRGKSSGLLSPAAAPEALKTQGGKWWGAEYTWRCVADIALKAMEDSSGGLHVYICKEWRYLHAFISVLSLIYIYIPTIATYKKDNKMSSLSLII